MRITRTEPGVKVARRLKGSKRVFVFIAVIGVIVATKSLMLRALPAPASEPSIPTGIQLDPKPPSVTSPAAKARLVETYGKTPLSFEMNQGQTDRRVKFLSRGSGYTLFLTGDEAVLALRKAEGGKQKAAGRNGKNEAQHPFSDAAALPNLLPLPSSNLKNRSDKDMEKPQGRSADPALQGHAQTPSPEASTPAVLRIKLAGANSAAKVTGLEELPGKTNYFIGNDPKKWRTNVPTYAKVRYQSVYPGVDLVYYGNQTGQLEYDFVLAAGADPNVIELAVVREGSAHGSLHIDAHGDLIVSGSGVRFHKPLVYQPIDSGNAFSDSDFKIQGSKLLDGRYLLTAENQIHFEVPGYDKSQPLIIDPVIAYSTLLGGTMGGTNGSEIATYTDPSTGHVFAYICGDLSATDFPTVNAYQKTLPGLGNVFVAKFDPSASGAASVIYSTYLGGSLGEGHSDCTVDAAGYAYITGPTESTNFPTWNAYRTTRNGVRDAFLTKFSTDGSALMYSTYFGGSDFENVFAIAVDAAGQAYITGLTKSADMPTVNPYQASSGSMSAGNAFVAGFNTTRAGSDSLIYSTYFGGAGDCEGWALATDASGNLHLGGITSSADLTIVNGFQATSNPTGSGASFYAKLNPSASGTAQLVYSTYLGLGGTYGLALDSSSNVYIVSIDTVTKINPFLAGAASLVYSTPLGQPVFEFSVLPIAVDASGNAFVVGTAGPGMPLVSPVQSSPNGVMQSINGGQRWTGLTRGLTDFPIRALAVDVSTSPRTLYAGTDLGSIFSTTDGGLNWSRVLQLPNMTTGSPACVFALVINSASPSNVYAGTSAGVFKTSDRGATWTAINDGLSSAAEQGVKGLLFDGGTLYAGAADGLYKLVSGATSWTSTALAVDVHNIAVDYTTSPHTIYTASEITGVFRSTDGSTTWVAANTDGQGGLISSIAVDPATAPSTLYGYDLQGANGGNFMWTSIDGGNTWNALGDPNFSGQDNAASIYVDTTTTPSTLYVRDAAIGISKSMDGGGSWTTILGAPMGAMAVDPTTANGTAPVTLYAGTSYPFKSAFVEELNPSGSAVLFSTYLGGILSTTIGTAIALDASDNIYIVGTIFPNPSYFPTVNAFEAGAALANFGSPGRLPHAPFFTKLGNQTLPESSSGSVTTEVGVQTGTLAITFPDISGSTTSGQPTLTVTPLSSEATANFSLSNNLGAYDISTTALYSGSITLCFQALTVNHIPTFNNLQLVHVVNGTPVNVTSSRDFSTRNVCGSVTSLSPFILMNPQQPPITWNNPASIIYGTALSDTQLNATASVPGTFAYSPSAGTILHAGNGQTLSVTFTPVDTISYMIVTKSVTINVLRATPLIVWNNPANVIYGTALSNAQLNATANTPGAFSYSPAAGTVLSPGSGQTLSVTFTPAVTADYTTATKTVSLNVLYSTATCGGDLGHTILQPINADGSSVFKLGSTVPTKFRVCDAHGVSVGFAGTVASYQLVAAGSATGLTVDEQVYSTAADTKFRWDSAAQQWIFNQATGRNNPTLSQTNTIYVFRINLNDGSYIQFQYGLK